MPAIISGVREPPSADDRLLITAQTLAICSTSNNQEFKAILQGTAGVVFLGTPHRGSASARIGEIARKAASVLLMDTNPRILDSISLRNSDLERCQDVFSSLWLRHGFSVKTFQEGLPLKLPLRVGQSKMAKVIILTPRSVRLNCLAT